MDSLGKYQLRGTLGRGAMGVVYHGWDAAIDRRVAIKTVKLADDQDDETREALGRFKREAQAAGRLVHPNIVGVYDYGETAEFAYIVMEFVEGRSLKSLLDQEKQLPPVEAEAILAQVLAGLAYSHTRGVIHRDIKPANIMLTAEGQVKIADFGVAKIESSTLTSVGMMIGTPAYMPPEQFLGEPADARADIYAAGIMLFHLLTGQRPYEGTLNAIMQKVLNPDPPPLASARVALPAVFDSVIARAIAKSPAARFATAADFARALREAVLDTAQQHDPDATMVAPARSTPATAKAAMGPGLASEETLALPRPTSEQKRDIAAAGARPWRKPALAGGGLLVLAAAGAAALLLRPRTTPPSTHAAVAHGAPPAMAQAPDTQAANTSANVTPANTKSAGAPSAGTGPANAQAAGSQTDNPQPVRTAANAAGLTLHEPAQAVPPRNVPGAIRAALAALPCNALAVTEENGALAVTGPVGGSYAEAAHEAATAAAPADHYTWAAQTVPVQYCTTLEVLRSLPGTGTSPGGAAEKPLTVAMGGASGRAHLVFGSRIEPAVTAPQFPAWLTVDYVSKDEVSHVRLKAADQSVRLAPGETRQMTAAQVGCLGPPYGTDLIVATASSRNLRSVPRTVNEKTADYLKALKQAVQTEAGTAGRIAIGTIVVDTDSGQTGGGTGLNRAVANPNSSLFASASLAGPPIKQLAACEPLVVLKNLGKTLKVKAGNDVGWLAKINLTTDKAGP